MTRDRDLVLDCVAAYRLTRLVTNDTILVNVRDDVIRWAYRRAGSVFNAAQIVAPGDWAHLAEGDPDAPKLATLVSCRFCAGIWVAAGVIAARSLAPRSWDWMARMLAVASAAALLARLEKP